MDRLARQSFMYQSICAQCRRRLLPLRASIRLLSTSTPDFADTPDPPRQPPIDIPDAGPAPSTQQSAGQSFPPSVSSTSSTPSQPQEARPSMLSTMPRSPTSNPFARPESKPPSRLGSNIGEVFNYAINDETSPHRALSRSLSDYPPLPEPHHLHIYSTKHNTHITLTKPDRNPIMSVSAGSIGFRKAARGTYDAGYQLGAYVMGRIQQQGLLTQIQHLEVVLRDFGPGREAVTKILLGNEGRNLRGRVVRVCDATRLKFGGTRSKKARRLG